MEDEYDWTECDGEEQARALTLRFESVPTADIYNETLEVNKPLISLMKPLAYESGMGAYDINGGQASRASRSRPNALKRPARTGARLTRLYNRSLDEFRTPMDLKPAHRQGGNSGEPPKHWPMNLIWKVLEVPVMVLYST